MKIRKQRVGKRLMAFFMAIVLTVGSFYMIPPKQVEAFDLVDKATGFAKGATTTVAKKALIASMDEMQEQTDRDMVILKFVEKRLKSSGQLLAEKVIASMQVMCQQILGELDKIDSVLENLENQNKEIKLQLDQLGINSSTEFMREFSENYKNVAEHYKNLLEYTKQYEKEQTEENLGKMQGEKDFLEQFYDSVTNGGGGMKYTYDFMDDIRSYSRVTSIYQPSDSLLEVDKFVPQPIGSQTDMTYLEAVQKYYEDKTSSQAMMYQAMSTNLNYAIVPLYYYLFDLQLYTSMRINKINENTSLSRTEKDEQLENAWNQFEIGQNNVWNIINQMCYANAGYINSLMRPYDTKPTKVTLDVQNKRTVYDYNEPNPSQGSRIKYDLKATELTKDISYLEYSLLKLRDGNLYGIMVDTQGNKTFTLRDLYEEFPYLGGIWGTDTVVSCDYLNLMNGSGAWEKFKLINSASELKNITSKSAYTGTDFWEYLMKTENIPGLMANYSTINPFYGVTSKFYNMGLGGGTDFDVDFYTLKNISKEDPAKATVRLDLENDIHDHEDMKEKPAAFIMKLEKGAQVPMQMELKQDAGVQTTFEKVTSDTKETITADEGKENIYTINAGEVLNINVKVDPGKKIKNAVLYGENTLGKWEALEKFIEETDEQYLLDYCKPNEDGSYTLATLPMTYRNAQLCIEVCDDDSVASHNVTLKQPEGDSRIQFASLPGISQKSFETGSTVQVVVLPEDGKLPDGISVKDVNGNELLSVAVAQADIENDQILPDGAVAYSFSMPNQDVNVSMKQTQGYTVYLSEDENGSLVFTDEGGNEKGITGNVGTFRGGERIYIRGVANKKDYYCENIVARNDGGSGAPLQIQTEEEGISFKMPQNDVLVTGTFSQRKNCEVHVNLQNTNGAVGRIQLDGNNTTMKTYPTGEKVTVGVIPQEGSWLESYAVTVKRGENVIDLPSTRTDSKLTNESEITFTMPSQNVTVDIVLNTGCANVYNGKLSVEAGLAATLTETQNGEERSLTDRLQEGTISFGGKDQATYALQIETTIDGAVPQVTYSGNSGNRTLSGNWENDVYFCEIGVPTEDFTVTVQNVGIRPEAEYDYMIPDYDTLCMYRDLINSDQTGTFKNASYLVTKDISCPQIGSFDPIDSFNGIFDGGGHAIKGMKIEQYAKDNAFVKDLSGCIKNLKFDGVTVDTRYGTSYTASAAAFAITMKPNAVIENCTVSESCMIVGGPIGGIATYVKSGAVIRNCGVAARVSCFNQYKENEWAGGIAAYSDGNIENCYFTGILEMYGGGGYRGNIIGGICADAEENGGGTIWNCYVGDRAFDERTIPLAPGRKNTVYEISNGSSISNCYISEETRSTLQKYKDKGEVTTYTPDDKVSQIAMATMKTNEFAQTLTNNITDFGVHQRWKQDDGENQGYPQFENISVRNLYSASAVSNEISSIQLQSGNNEATDKLDSIPDGMLIQVIGTTQLEKVQVKVKAADSGQVIKEMECTVDENGSFATSFRMPACDVTVEAVEYKLHTGAIPLMVDSIPSGKAKASLQNAEGTEIDRAELTETVYVSIDELDEAEYKFDGIVVKSTAMNAPYQVYMDLESIRQEDGRYAISIDGDAEKLVRGNIGIYLVLEKNVYTIQTEVKPEEMGVITCDKTSAVCGDEVSFEATAFRGYYCTSVVLCNKEGQYLQTLKMSNQSKGTFKMRSEDVIVRANFETIARRHDIYTKDSEQLTLSVTDRYGTRIERSVTGSTVNVHYQKDSFSAAEQISLYNASTYGKSNAQPLQTWIADKTSDDLSGGISFTMPDCDVIVVSKPLDDVTYQLTKDIEGKGRIFVKDIDTGTKETANQGEKIFISACADRGWTFDESKSQLQDTKGKAINLDVTKHEHFATFDMPAQDLVLKAVFTQNDYKVTITPPEKGTIQVLDENNQEVDLTKLHYQDILKVKVTGIALDSVKYMPEDGNEEAEQEILLDENGEGEFAMPESNITVYAGTESDPSKVKTYTISTVEDLKQAIEIVKTEPNANFKLLNNLRCDNETFTEGIGSEKNPYCGTFDGQGYYIFKFNMDGQEGDAALFGAIGKKGTVKRLGVFFDKTSGKRAAAIAVTNEGIIDECISGTNVTGTFSEYETKERRSLSEINTFATGTMMAGGIVVENRGTIRNTSSYTKVAVSGENGVAGGIAAVNEGTIINCFNRGSVEATGNGSIAGGIAGENRETGTIQIVYCTSSILTGETKGATYGVNEGAVESAFYLESLRNSSDQGMALTMQQMKKDTLLTWLNSLVKGQPTLRDWYIEQDKNSGYPVLSSSKFSLRELIDEEKGVKVTGMMHEDTKLNVNKLDSKDAIYQAFEKYAKEKGMKLQIAAAPSLQYENGEDADYEGTLNLSINASKYEGKGYKVLVYRDGKVEEVEIDIQTLASVDIDSLPPFAVLSKETTQNETVKPSASDKKNASNTVTGNTNKTKTTSVNATKTGDSSNVLLWSGLLLASVVGVGIIIRQKRKRKTVSR